MAHRLPIALSCAVVVGLASAALAAEPSPAAAGDERPANVTLHRTKLGRVYADGAGKTLYTYLLDRNMPGASACIDACVAAWPPLKAPDDAKPIGAWTTIKRPEGGLQWAFDGKPLYTFTADAAAGDA